MVIMFDKWKKEYIDNLDLNNIKYLNLTPEELNNFFSNNYFDEYANCFVSSKGFSTKPMGFNYLDYNYLYFKNTNENEKRFLIGIVTNNKGKKTIVSFFKYYRNYFFDEEQKIPLTYILSIEVNEFLRRKGLFKKLIQESLKYINQNNPVITTIESDMGYEIGVIDIIRNIYYSNGFSNDIRSIAECDQDYLKLISKSNLKGR